MPTEGKVIKVCTRPCIWHVRTASVSSANRLFTKQCNTCLSIVSAVIFISSVYGIKAASNRDLLIRSTQLKLTCRSLAVCTRDGKIGFINTQDIQNKNGEKRLAKQLR